MRLFRYTLLMMIMVTFTATKTSAKPIVTPKAYMFGFIANFSDSLVYFTDIQTVDSVWYDHKTKFLMDRSTYSNQLRQYFANTLNMPHRTCIVVFALTRKEIEKKYLKQQKNVDTVENFWMAVNTIPNLKNKYHKHRLK